MVGVDEKLLKFFTEIQRVIDDVYDSEELHEYMKKNEADLEKLCQMKDPSTENSLVHFAASSNNYEILQILIESGSNVDSLNKNHQTPLHFACSLGHIESSEVLLKYGANINLRDNDGHAAIHLCFEKSSPNFKIAQLLMLYKTDINFKRSNGETCLHIASSQGNISAVNWILKKEGVRINAKDSSGQTPLLKSLNKSRTQDSIYSCSHLQMVQYLLNKKADPKAIEEKNQTIIHKAVFSDHMEVIPFLKTFLDKEEYLNLINSKDIDGKTALHYCSIFDKLKSMKMLIECGIDIEILDNYKQTAFDVALKSDKFEICSILKSDFSSQDVLKSNDSTQKIDLNLTLRENERVKFGKKNLQNLFKNNVWLNSIILYGHNLTSIPSNNLSKLTILSLRNNGLKEPPGNLESLTNLIEVDLSENQLQSAPNKLFKLTKLKKISLSRNEFKKWPTELNSSKSLEEVDLSFNKINFESPEVRKSMDLTALISPRSGNQSEKKMKSGTSFFQTRDSIRDSLSSTISDLQSKISKDEHSKSFLSKKSSNNISKVLKKLNLSSNGIQQFPYVLFELESIESLNLSSNEIGDVPTKISDLKQLRYLNISNCSIIKFPKSLMYLKLIELNLSKNSISSIPPVIIDGIENLILDNCKFKDISQFLENNANSLKYVSARENKITDVPTYIGSNSIEKIDLFGNEIEIITEAIDEFDNLTFLNLSKNQIKSIHSNFSQLIKLKYLNLSFNKIQKLPKDFENLNQLIELQLNYNNLNEITKLDTMKDLNYLNLSNNYLTNLPKGFQKLKNLKILNLSENRFTSINKGIFECVILKDLDFHGNLLTNLDNKISKLKRLRNLNLNDNEIQRLPNSIVKLTNLDNLSMINNSNLDNLPNDILNWISFHKINFLNFFEHPIKILDSVWIGSIGIANNLTIIKKNEISNILWLIEDSNYNIRIQHPKSLNHKIINVFEAIGKSIDFQDYFIQVKDFVQQNSGDTLFCSDGGKQFSLIFIIAFIMISKGISMRNSMVYLKHLNDIEISNLYIDELIKFDKSRYVSFLKSEFRILLENESERENFKEFCQEENLLTDLLFWEVIEIKYKYVFSEKDRLKLGCDIFDEFLNLNSPFCKIDLEKKYILNIEKSLFELSECPMELFDDCVLAIEKKLGNYQNKYRESKFYGENKSISKSENTTPSSSLLRKESSRRLSQQKVNARLSSKFNLYSKTSPPESQRYRKDDGSDGKISPRKSFRFSISNLSKKSSSIKSKAESPKVIIEEEVKEVSFDDSKRKVPILDFDK
eukprot:gene2986-4996_t